MPNTGERREIKRYTAAKESETVAEAAKIVSETKQRSAKDAEKKLSRMRRKDHVPTVPLTDEQASDRMVDEGARPAVPK